MPLPLLMAGGAALGALAGAIPYKSSSNSTSGINLSPASLLELQANGILGQGLTDFSSLVGAGPGQSDVTSALGANRDLAELLRRYSQEGGSLPTSGDISGANSLAAQLFQGQRTAMGQAFEDQRVQANRKAALMGRAADDPILAAKLAQEQTRQGAMLDANQGAFAAQYAMDQPMQRLGFMQGRAGVLGGLASQALANRQALMAMGEGIQTNERNFRLQTGTRWGNQETTSGGGLGGALKGAIGGMGAGLSMGSALGGMGAMSMPSAPAGSFSMAPMVSNMGSFFNRANPFSGAAGPNLAFTRPSPMDPGWSG